MNIQRQGWNVLIFLIILSIGMLIATNCFKIAINLRTTSRLRYRYHQEIRLLEGLLTYGVTICSENRSCLFSWGACHAQSMYMNFNPWPSEQLKDIVGRYSGLLTITSQKGIVHLHAQLYSHNLLKMSASCDISPVDTKNLQGKICVIHWQIHQSAALV